MSIARYPTIVTTETTSSLLRWMPGFASTLIHLKHGAGDREGGYNAKHAGFDLTLVNGPKDKQRLIERGLGNDENIHVVGYGKFELVRDRREPLFAERQADRALQSAFRQESRHLGATTGARSSKRWKRSPVGTSSSRRT